MISNEELKGFAKQIRIETLKCLRHRGFGHVGGCMSVVEVLAVLYGSVMKYDPANPKMENRDYLVMSKGHAGPTVFATLALKGFFPLEWLNTMCEPHTLLPSHCDRLRTPGIDVSTGSLGQGLSIAAGLAKAFKIKNQNNWVYTILGDGELGEGQNWEAAQFAAHYSLDNMVAFVDWNKRQVDGYLENIMAVGDIAKKFEAFGWYALTVDGKDVDAIVSGIEKAKTEHADQPIAIILDGVKGSGVREYEEMFDNHHFVLDQEQVSRIIDRMEGK